MVLLKDLLQKASAPAAPQVPRKTLLRGVDLFAGAGGFTIGAMQAGCDIAVAVEKNRDAARTARRAGHRVAREDLRDFAYDEILFHIDLLIGGPPCQPFSSMGEGKGEYDLRDGFPLVLDAIDRLGPTRAVFENVVGFLSPRHRAYREKVLQDMARRFKHVGTWRLNAKDFGVPQDRERVFIWGAERHIPPPFPTHGPLGVRPYVSVREAIPNFERPAIHVHSVSAKSRSIDEPSPTVATKGTIYTAGKAGIVYPYDWRKDKARRLRVEELKAIQAFPGSFTFTGSLTAQYTQVGNAVPPPLGKAVVFAMMAGIDSRSLTPQETVRVLKAENRNARLFDPRKVYNPALVGVTNTSEQSPGELVAVYSYEKLRDINIREILKRDPNTDPEEAFVDAVGHLEYNQCGLRGQHMPIVIRTEDPVDWDYDEDGGEEDDASFYEALAEDEDEERGSASRSGRSRAAPRGRAR